MSDAVKRAVKIKAQMQDTEYIFIPVTKGQMRSLWDEYILQHKDIPLSENSREILHKIMRALRGIR